MTLADVLLLLLLSASRAEATRIEVDKGRLEVRPGETLAYDVKFKRDRSFLAALGLKKPEEGCAECAVEFSSGTLRVRTVSGVSALAKVVLPAGQPLELALEVGTASIGRLAGRVTASVGVGTLEFDAAALGQGACVDALVKVGTVDNDRDADCRSTPVKLRVGTGTVSVD